MSNNNFHDLTIRKQIEESVEYWNSGRSNFDHEFKGKTVEEAISMWEATAKDTKDIECALYSYVENADLLASEDDVTFVNILLNHPERHRLRLINDGSYRTHRIWARVDHDGHIRIAPSICWMDSEFKRMSKQLERMPAKAQIDFLFKNFEVVYIQATINKTREELEQWISCEKLSHKSNWANI